MALETRALSKYYGGRAVVDEVSIRVEQGEVVGLLGPLYLDTYHKRYM